MAELIPGLPEEIAVECLIRSHYTNHRVAAGTCRRWRQFFHSREFYHLRKNSGHTHKAVFLVQSLPIPSDGTKHARPVAFGVSVFDPINEDWTRLQPISEYPDGLPLFCLLISSDGKLVLIGGWDPASYQPVEDVFVYEFTTQRWRRGKGMPDKRSFFAAAENDGRIFIAGGHDESKNALSTAWVYDVATDEWSELPPMSQERDECEGVVIGSELWVVSGYRTESQGIFEDSVEIFETRTGQWRLVEGAWEGSRCPRSNTGIGRDGKLFSWAAADAVARVGVCGVDLGEKTFVSGSEYQGGSHGFFMVEGQNGKFNRMVVPTEFSGFVQSGCVAEI